MKQAAREAIYNKLDQFDTRKNILKDFVSNTECSFQVAVYHILSELHLRRVFPGVQFVNTKSTRRTFKNTSNWKTIKFLPENSTDIFKRNNIDHYLARPSVSFCDENYSILDSFCFGKFTAYYGLIYKPKETNEGEEYRLDLLPDSLMGGNHESLNYPKMVKFMNSNGKIQCRKVLRVLRYHTPNKYRFQEKYAHPLLFLLFPFWSEKEFLGEKLS